MSTMINESKTALSIEEIAHAERELGVAFPAEYRNFLLAHNGGASEPDGFAITWRPECVCGEDWRTSTLSRLYSISDERLSNLVRSNRVTFEGRLPKETISVGADAGGNQILLGVAGALAGRVLFWVKDHEVDEGETPGYDNVGLVADNFEDFINNRLY